ncbi:MAG: dynamin family protein [Salegentibacter mishustinae]|nr:dynamin family protein [Salegentibacter mishustinae]
MEQTIEDCKNRRITDWFETFIYRVKEESNNDTFSIEINGCDNYEKGIIETILKRENDLVNYRKIDFVDDSSIGKIYKDINEFLDFALNSNEDVVKEAIGPNIQMISDIRRNKVEIPVIATMSSGKSTLLNALIGKDYLFEDTGTATATTCNVKISNKRKAFVAQAIDNGKIIEEADTDISRFLEKWNSSANTKSYSKLKLNLEGPVLDLNSSTLELNFIDTPGPNTSKYKNHKFKTYDYLKDNQQLPIVLYVLDPEKMDSNDDDNTLKEIRKVFKGNKQNMDRIIFVYNKVDREELGKKSFSEILQKIENFLRKYDIENPKIFPVSAIYAKYAQLQETLSYTEEGELINLRRKFIPAPNRNHIGYQLLNYAPLTENQKKQLRGKISESEVDADMVYSGLAAIKLYIEDYIVNHHKKNQYKDLLDIAYKVSKVIENKIKLVIQNLEKRTTEEEKKRKEGCQKEKEELKKRKKEALQALEKIEYETMFIKDALRDIDQFFDDIKDKTFRQTNLKVEDSKKIIKAANSAISNLRASIETDVISKMNDGLVDYLSRLKNEVVNKFELEDPSLEIKTFNAELLNKINVLDFNSINKYKTKGYETRKREEEKEVESEKWYRRLFGWKDTKIITVEYKVEKEVVNAGKLYNELIYPINKQFKDLVNQNAREFSKVVLEYNILFAQLVNHSFGEALTSVYKETQKETTLSIEKKEYQTQKLNEIQTAISKYKILEYNEKIYRKPALTC